MALTQRAIAAQEALRTEQEQYVAWALPTGIAEHNREFQETKIIFPSGSKIAIDWPAFEKGETQCLWLGYPLPTELAEALKEWDFKTLFLSQEQDHDVQDAIHEIITHEDRRAPGQHLYLYATQRELLLGHPWSEWRSEANTIYAAWLRNARAQIIGQPEAVFIEQSERESFVKNIPSFKPKKMMSREKLKSHWLDPDLIASQIEKTLRQARREKEK